MSAEVVNVIAALSIVIVAMLAAHISPASLDYDGEE